MAFVCASNLRCFHNIHGVFVFPIASGSDIKRTGLRKPAGVVEIIADELKPAEVPQPNPLGDGLGEEQAVGLTQQETPVRPQHTLYFAKYLKRVNKIIHTHL